MAPRKRAEKTFQTHIYLTADEAKKIDVLADQSCRSITQQIRWLLIEALKRGIE